LKTSSTDLAASEKRDFHAFEGWEDRSGTMGPEFAGKTGLTIGGSSGIGKAVGTLQLEKRVEAVVIMGKNQKNSRLPNLCKAKRFGLLDLSNLSLLHPGISRQQTGKASRTEAFCASGRMP
jgi:hypothetical protein